MGHWNGVDVDSFLASDPFLAKLRDAERACDRSKAAYGDTISLSGAAEGRKDDSASLRAIKGDQAEGRKDESASSSEAACTAFATEEYSWTDLFAPGEAGLPRTLTFAVMEIAYNMAFYGIIFSAGAFSDQVRSPLIAPDCP
jgi:hypothetical protein